MRVKLANRYNTIMVTTEGTYACNRTSTWDAYWPHLGGSAQALLVAVCTTAPDATLYDALERAAQARGYADGATWLVLDAGAGAGLDTQEQSAVADVDVDAQDVDPSAGSDGWETLPEDSRLDASEVDTIIEGLDPMCVVVLDAEAVQVFAQAYALADTTPGYALALGRPSYLIPHAAELIKSDDGKQQLWNAIKSLPAMTN